MDEKIIFWGIGCNLQYTLAQPEPIIRHGIDEVLTRLSAQGFTHYAIQAHSTNDEVTDALQQLGLEHHFEKAIGADDISVMGEFSINNLSEALDKEPEYLARNAIVVAHNSNWTIEHSGILHLFQEMGYRYDAVVAETAIQNLHALGGGDFATTFQRLYESTPVIEKSPHVPSLPNREIRAIQLGEDIPARIKYGPRKVGHVSGPQTTPTIEIQHCPQYVTQR